MPCWPAPGSARSIPSFSLAFRPTLWPPRQWLLSAKRGITADEAPRGGATPAQDQRDQALQKLRRRQMLVVQRTGGDVHWIDGAITALHEMAADVRRLPARRDERRRPAVHPLHVRLHRHAQRRGALRPAAISSMPSMTHRIHVRLSRRRYLLVHGGCRLGHRPQLYRLWPARQRRDDLMFEGVPTYPTPRASGRSAKSTR